MSKQLGLGDGGMATANDDYLHDIFLKPLAYGRGCPMSCPLYKGEVNYAPGLCPVAEDLMPRLMLIGTSGSRQFHRENAEKLHEAAQEISSSF